VLRPRGGAAAAAPAADSDDDTTFALLASGASACMFPRIPGGAAPLGAAGAIGAATAQLVTAMAGLPPLGMPCPNPLYRHPYRAHHATATGGRDAFLAQMRRPEFDATPGVAAARDALVAGVAEMEALMSALDAEGGLPEQAVHADLHSANVLVDAATGAVTGVLDFEFAVPREWRVMEVCVGLSKYVALPNIDGVFEAWVAGYAAGGGALTDREAALVAPLIEARVLNNVIYFVGRAIAGEDGIEALSSRAEMYAARCAWLRERTAWIHGVVARHLVKGGGDSV
jgi:Ser/Thr protein kinase RdoA (MazF antagonist)